MLNLFKDKINTLVVGAHPDDFEIGCAGTLLKYYDYLNVHIAIFSDRMDTGEMRNLDELYESLAILGIHRSCVTVFEIPTRIFHEHQSKIRNCLLQLKEKYQIELVFCPPIHDIHQDHVTVATEVIRIFREKSVMFYEVLRSAHGFMPQFHVSIPDEIIEKKISAIRCYKSQFSSTKSGGYYFSKEVLEGLMFARGGQFGAKYAEAFEIVFLKL